MAPQLDDVNGPVLEQGRDINVINQRLSPKDELGVGSKIFEVILWVLGIIPGLIFLFIKIGAKKYFQQLQQKLQHDASEIDNYMEQRVIILQNASKLLDKAIKLDKETFTEIARLRSGTQDGDSFTKAAGALDTVNSKINIAMEKYPDLKAHDQIEQAMKQNSLLQKEITAAREIYNDTINKWNTSIYEWPAKMIVAAKEGYTTRIPFATTQEIKQAARGTFF